MRITVRQRWSCLGSLALAVPLAAQTGPAATVYPKPQPSQNAPAVRQESPASSRSPLQRTVSLNLRNVRLEQALEAIDKQANLGLTYSRRIVPLDSVVSIRVEKVSVAQALQQLLQHTQLKAEVTSAGMVMLVKQGGEGQTSGAAQEEAITGRVTDSATGEPLKGVIVSIKGRDIKVLTNAKGGYTISNLPPGTYTVMARLLGYREQSQEVTLSAGQPLRVDFALRMGVSNLQQVVTTASGAQRRVETGNDITVLNVDSLLTTMPVRNVTDLLETRVPGLIVTRTSGAPGSPTRLRLRGTSSARLNNDPIVIVDGIRLYSAQSDTRNQNLASTSYGTPSPLEDIDPHSIETIEVFKGPSAAAMYGADAANGVIVVTTKRGRAGPARWNATAEYGTTSLPGKYPNSYLRWGHLPWDRTPILCPVTNRICIGDSISKFQVLNDPELTVLSRGDRELVAGGVSGGNNAITYAVNLSYTDELGFIKLPGFEQERYRTLHGSEAPQWMKRPQRFTKWNATYRQDMTVRPNLTLGAMTGLSRWNQQTSSLEGQLSSLMMTYVDPVTGLYYQPEAPTIGGQEGVRQVDELLTSYYERVTSQGTSFMGRVVFGSNLLSWLTIGGEAGLDIDQGEDGSLLPRRAVLNAFDSIGRVAAARKNSIVTTLNLRGTASIPLRGGYRMRLSNGFNFVNRRTSDMAAFGSDLTPGGSSLSQAGKVDRANESKVSQATFGWFFEPVFSSRSNLTITPAFRLDGGNANGRRARLSGLPKLGVSYVISEEPFFPRSFISSLILRLSYGHANTQPEPGDRLRLYTKPTQTWVDGGFKETVELARLGNTLLRPERSKEVEGGFDAAFLNDRISFGFTGYRQMVTDALMETPLPPSVNGGTNILRNVGNIRKTGMSITAGAELVRSDFLIWGTNFHLSQLRNKVLSLGQGVTPFGSNSSRFVAGYPLLGRWGKPVLGFQDRDSSGTLSSDEVLYGDTLVYLGAAEPNFIASLSTSARFFKGIVGVSANFSYSDGQTQVRDMTQMRRVSIGYNDPTAPLMAQLHATAVGSDIFNFQVVNVLRFQSLSLSFNAPPQLVSKLGARGVSVWLSGRNLGMRTNYRGKDPEVNSTETGSGGTFDGGALPQPRTWQLSFSIQY
jgi:TonB-dependent SusC/RagA subfamily outer membrane receptor